MQKLEDHGYWAIIGIALVASIFVYGSGNPLFLREWLPIYLTEGLLFLGLGLLFTDYVKVSKTDADRITSMMALIWLLNQVVVWWNLLPKGIFSWITAAVNLIAFLELFGYELIDITEITEQLAPLLKMFSYQVDMFLLAFFAAVKIYLNLSNGTSMWAPITLWGVAVLLVASKHILTVYDEERAEIYQYLAPLGTLLAVYVAFAIKGAGLNLLQLP